MAEYNKNLTIGEIRKKKQILTGTIINLINDFQTESGVRISSIRIKHEDIYLSNSGCKSKSEVIELEIETSLLD